MNPTPEQSANELDQELDQLRELSDSELWQIVGGISADVDVLGMNANASVDASVEVGGSVPPPDIFVS